MKKIVASVGLVALGASGLSAASVAGLSAETVKPWTVSATLRGFYDDNLNSSHSDKQDVFGVEASPSLGFAWASDLTSISLGYTYTFKYYDHRPAGNTDRYDQEHEFNVALAHTFSPRASLSVKDSFVIGQEPDTLRSGNFFEGPLQRLAGDNIRNLGTITLNAQLTRSFGVEVGYVNSYFDYSQHGAVTDLSGNFFPSASGLLDRIEHAGHLDGRWQFAPETTGVLGYEFREVNYIGDEFISDPFGIDPLKSDVRDSRSHYGYLGVDHAFRPDLSGSVRLGARFTDYYNDPTGANDVSPYAMASLRYVYLPESWLEAGFSFDQTATDQFSIASDGNITRSADSASFWASIHHQFTPQLSGTLLGQVQNSELNGGTEDGRRDLFYIIGISLEYKINTYLSTHIGYNFDKLDSDLNGRSFDRNRVYVGVTASY
jgi:hypothetical protein